MKRVFFLLLLLFPAPLQAKLEGLVRIDSLLKAEQMARNDSVRVAICDDLAFYYRTVDPNTGIKYANKQLEMATPMGWKAQIAKANRNLGTNYKFKSDYSRAIDYYFRSIKIDEEIGNKSGIGASYSYIGVIYQSQLNYEKALEYGLKSLAINEELLHENSGAAAEKMPKKAGATQHNIETDKLNIAGDLGNIGIVYMALKDYPKALEYYQGSLRIFQELKNTEGIAYNLGNIGEVYRMQHNYASALEYDFDALRVFQELGDNSSIALNLGNIGEVYYSVASDTTGSIVPGKLIMPGKTGNLTKAIAYLTQAIDLSKEIGQLDNIIEYSKCLSDVYATMGSYKAAYDNYVQYTLTKDSVLSKDSKYQLARLETERALYLKDKQILIDQLEVAKKKNERILLFIGIGILLTILALGVRRFRAERRSNRILARERKRHLARIAAQQEVLTALAYTQSHDVRGKVATILGLVQVFNFEDPADADNKQIMYGIANVTEELDELVKDMIRKENNLDKK